MKFWYFNVQLTPIEGGEGKVGEEGYRKLFDKLNAVAEDYWKKELLHDLAFVSRGNYHAFKPFEVHNEYASGKLIKFDLIDKVYQPYTDEELFDSRSKPASSDPVEFHFYYSFKHHVFAIEQKKKIPSSSVIKKILYHLIGDVARDLFKNYYLHVSLLNHYSLVDELEERAKGYYSANIEVCFTNSWDFVDEEVQELEQELRDKGVNKSQLTERAAAGGMMSGLSNFAEKLLMLSIPAGHAKIQYLDSQTGKRERFNTDEKPVAVEVDDTLEDGKTKVSEEELNRRVRSSVVRAVRMSLQSLDNIKRNHEIGERVLGNSSNND